MQIFQQLPEAAQYLKLRMVHILKVTATNDGCTDDETLNNSKYRQRNMSILVYLSYVSVEAMAGKIK